MLRVSLRKNKKKPGLPRLFFISKKENIGLQAGAISISK